jgi:hypothetical protein
MFAGEGGWERNTEIAAESGSRLLSNAVKVCIGFYLDSYSLVQTKIAPGPDWWNLLASLSKEGR